MKKLILPALAALAVAGAAHAGPACQGEACGDISYGGGGDGATLTNHGKRPILVMFNDGWNYIRLLLQPGETKPTGEAVLNMMAHYSTGQAEKRPVNPRPAQSQ